MLSYVFLNVNEFRLKRKKEEKNRNNFAYRQHARKRENERLQFFFGLAATSPCAATSILSERFTVESKAIQKFTNAAKSQTMIFA